METSKAPFLTHVVCSVCLSFRSRGTPESYRREELPMSTGVGGLRGVREGAWKEHFGIKGVTCSILKSGAVLSKMLSLHFLTHFAAGFSKCLKKGTVKSFNCGNMLPNLPQENPSPEQGQTPCKGDWVHSTFGDTKPNLLVLQMPGMR